MLCLVRMALWRNTDDEGQLSADPDSYEDENPKHIKLERNGVEIELHRYVIDRDRSATSKVLEQWAAEELQGGVGLRQLCDWAMLLHRHHQDIDRQRIETLLLQARLLRGWHHTCQGVNQLK